MAQKLPEPDPLLSAVRQAIMRGQMLPPGARVGVAVSGGADSVVLLEVLRRFAPEFDIQLSVLHVNHGLRGPESDQDEAFVARLAETAGLPILRARLEPPANGNLEQEARRLRREFFLSHGFDQIALGHTRSDQAETVLHRFLRGSGPTGIAAMYPVTPEGFIRPLLSVSRTQVREWAAAQGLTWREDSSNQDPRFTRNRIRTVILPTLTRDLNPNLEAVLASSAILVQAEEAFWNQEVERIYAHTAKASRLGSLLRVPEINSLPLALRRRLIRRALAEVRLEKMRGLDFDHIEAVLALCDSVEGHNRVLIPGADCLRSFDTLLLMRPGRLAEDQRGYRFKLPLGQRVRLPAGAGEIYLERLKSGSGICATFKEDGESRVEQAYLAEEAVSGSSLVVRNWEPGDELHTPGHRTAEKIKNLFQEHHIKLWERRHWPVVVCQGQIVWARRFGAAISFVRQPAAGVLRLVYKPEE